MYEHACRVLRKYLDAFKSYTETYPKQIHTHRGMPVKIENPLCSYDGIPYFPTIEIT